MTSLHFKKAWQHGQNYVHFHLEMGLGKPLQTPVGRAKNFPDKELVEYKGEISASNYDRLGNTDQPSH